MDVNLRKTATDTAYIVVGVGVLGFQQAQVKRRDAIAACQPAAPGRPQLAQRSRPTRSRPAPSVRCELASLG